MSEGIHQSEYQKSVKNTQRFKLNLNVVFSSLNNTVHDWAKWDDTYLFVEDNNTIYRESNLVEATYQNLQLNMMLFFNQDDHLVYGQLFNPSNHTINSPDTSTIEQLTRYRALFTNDTWLGNQGLILLNDAPVLVVSHSILTSDAEGPSHGTLIMGRYLDQAQLALLGLSTGLPVSSSLVTAQSLSNDFALAKENLFPEQSFYIYPLNDTSIAGYILLNDVEGEPLLIIKVVDERTELMLGMSGMAYFVVLLLVIAVVMFVVMSIMLDRTVISRLTALSDTVTKVRSSNDKRKRVPIKGNDELSSLGKNVNSMLDEIERHTYTLEQTVAERTKDLVENRKQTESILQASPDAIVVMDLKGTITECNSRVTELSGFTRGDLLGKSALDFIAEGYKKEYITKHRPLVTKHKGAVRFESRFLRKIGDYPAEYSVSVIRNEDYQPIGYVGVIRDLSEKKQMEHTLMRSQRLAAIGELSSMIGHDLRNPLAAIRNADYYIKKKCSGCDKPMVSTMLDVIDKSIDHANSIIKDLLEYSKEIHLDLSVTSPKSLLEKTLSLVAIPDGVNIVDLTTVDMFKADEVKAERVYINLMKNAFDAMPSGGTLKVVSSLQTDRISISFIDSGQGISPEMLSQIFSPLFTTKAQGMGFGLSISKRIVEAHGGTISVESKLGEGTTFTATFPLEPNPNADVSGGFADGLTSDSLEPI
jgi:PAS domain S-box-containing protein